MSEQQAENPEAVELPRSGDSAFSALMDVLAPEPGGEEGGEGAAAPGQGADAGAGAAGGAAPGTAAPGADGAPTPGAPVAGGPGTTGGDAAPAGVPGADGVVPAGGAAPASGGTDLPESWTATAASLAPRLGELSTGFEAKVNEAYTAQALTEAREEYGKYFEALEQHPRLLAGQDVPKLDGSDGTERLRDANDAREWQEALKHVLAEEVRSRVEVLSKDQSAFVDTVHASIDLFKNNTDLVPYTKDFDVELATRFAEMATPYELRVEGKLQGYSIPVQPLIDQLRTRIAAERAAAASPPPAAPAAAGSPPAPAAAAPVVDPPQAGIPNKAGNSGEQGEDFSALWGTLNLPNITL